MTFLNRFLFALIVATSALNLHAQKNLIAEPGDTLQLNADEYRGNIQWQFSSDSSSWGDLANEINSTLKVAVIQFPSYYRAKVTEEGCDDHFSEVVAVDGNLNALLWSDAATWGGTKPSNGDEVVIPEGQYIILDENPPALGGLTINGTLQFAEQDLELESEWIIVHGTFRIGYESDPFEQSAILTLNDSDTEADNMGMGTRGLLVMGGQLELHGMAPQVIWTKINEHAEAGSTALKLIESVDWNVGDEIVIAPTDYYQAGNRVSVTQKVALTALDNDGLTIADGLNANRWGLLQYPSNSGMSLDEADLAIAPSSSGETPLVLDERAEVGNLSRNIVIQAPDDDLWNSQGFGVHTMIMPGSSAHVEGVEFRRAGQRGRIRRYPWHWHILSYDGEETLSDATGQYFRKNTINESANRGIVIHGTNGVLVQDNIIFNTRGHGIFTEDAVERRNTIDHNLVLHVRNPEFGDQLMEHEIGSFGSSGFWIANPDNYVTNNVSADCQTFGYWLAFPTRPFGPNSNVLADDGQLLRPNRLLFGVFDNNTAHSNGNDGLHLDDPQIDDDGNTSPVQYWSTTDGRTDFGTNSFENLKRFELTRFKTWKNLDNGSWDRGVWTDMIEFVSADNCGRFFAGSGAEGVIERGLVVGTSLNFMMNGTGRPAVADFQFFPSSAPVAFATYHSAFSMRDNILVNFQVDKYDRAGVFSSDDYYLRPVEKGMIRNTGNLFIESHPGVKLTAADPYFTLASALWDPYGFWGPENNFVVYDDPFLTHGKTIHTLELGTEIAGGVSVTGPFYGFSAFVLHGVGNTPPQGSPDSDLMAIHVDRFDPDDLDNSVASWDVISAQPGWSLNHMRDFATSPDGIYELTFPDETIDPTDFLFEAENMLEETDLQIIGVQFDGDIDPVVYIQQEKNANNFHVYAMVNSMQEVADSQGETWWQDKVNNRVWIKIRGGRWVENEFDTGFEATINEKMQLLIRPN